MIKLKEKLALLATDPRNIGRLCELIGSMPNIETSTAGGKVFWDTLASYEGWKLQRNKLTHHCRILDPNDIRKAWGSESAMMEALERLKPTEKLYSTNSSSNNKNSLADEIRKLGDHIKMV